MKKGVAEIQVPYLDEVDMFALAATRRGLFLRPFSIGR
jgi:hypothetical protein